VKLFDDPVPPSLEERGIDLRNCGVVEMLESLSDESADLVVADPPWDYVQHHGATRADNHYDCLRVPRIVEHVNFAARVGQRLALWITFPLLGEWQREQLEWGRPVTGGAWVKSGEGDAGHYGQGYHWAGCSELVLIYTQDGAHTDRTAPLRNAWVEPPAEHSRKPVGWQAQWIRRWVPPGGLVVDLYAGLGSVAEAVLCAGGGRRYIGAEIDADRHRAALGLLVQAR
jgi:hypothetical protein